MTVSSFCRNIGSSLMQVKVIG
uniref:Uncharacterized protein n=1 Tax=Arundo donax TaxID=35708 RepID=A0A0A8YWJ4_ARUDO